MRSQGDEKKPSHKSYPNIRFHYIDTRTTVILNQFNKFKDTIVDKKRYIDSVEISEINHLTVLGDILATSKTRLDIEYKFDKDFFKREDGTIDEIIIISMIKRFGIELMHFKMKNVNRYTDLILNSPLIKKSMDKLNKHPITSKYSIGLVETTKNRVIGSFVNAYVKIGSKCPKYKCINTITEILNKINSDSTYEVILNSLMEVIDEVESDVLFYFYRYGDELNLIYFDIYTMSRMLRFKFEDKIHDQDKYGKSHIYMKNIIVYAGDNHCIEYRKLLNEFGFSSKIIIDENTRDTDYQKGDSNHNYVNSQCNSLEKLKYPLFISR